MKNTQVSGYCPELDALRFWAFIQVFLLHSGRYVMPYLPFGDGWGEIVGTTLQSGKFGVDLFFCLSSFLITSLLFREWDSKGSFDIKKFWFRRCLRIWPLYYAFIIMATAILILSHSDKTVDFKTFTTLALFMGNFHAMHFGWPHEIVLSLWSVSVEEQFYIAWPILLLLLKPNRLVKLAVGGLILGLLSRFILLELGHSEPGKPYLWVHTLARLDPLMTGALFAAWVRAKTWSPSTTLRILLGLMGTLVPVALTFVYGPKDISEGTAAIWGYTLIAISSSCVLAAIYGIKLRVPKVLTYLGKISYGLYVYHMLALGIVFRVFARFVKDSNMSTSTAVAFFIGSLFMTIVVSAISYRFLETPFLKLKEKFSSV